MCAGKCEQIRLLAFFAAKYSPFFIADFLLHVKNDDKNNKFFMPIIGKEERRI